MEEKVYFQNSKGDKLYGILSMVSDLSRPVIIIAHGHHSTKDRKSYTIIQGILNKKNISTFRFDFYGHGESEGKFENATVSEAVDDILQAIVFLKSRGFEKIGLIGSSYGGLASIMAASKSKDLYILALKSPVSNYEEREKAVKSKEELDDWKRKGYTKYKEDNEEIKLNYIFFEDFKNNNGYKAAPKIKAQTLIVHGDNDQSVPLKQSIKTSKLIPNCQLKIVKGADHRYTNPQLFNEMLRLLTDFIIQNSH